MVGWCGRETKYSRCEGNLCLLAESKQLLVGLSQFYALTYQHEGLHAFVNHAGCLLDGTFLRLRIGVVAADEIDLLRSVFYHSRLCILGEIEHHRARTSALGDKEGTSHSPGDVLCTTNLIVPLRDGLRHADHIHLLESVCTQHGSTYLTADNHHRGGVDHRVGNACDGVHRTWTARHERTAHFAAYSGVALSGMNCSLFVANQNVMQRLLVVVEGIVGGHDGTAWVTEKHIHTLMFEAPHQSLCTGYLI